MSWGCGPAGERNPGLCQGRPLELARNSWGGQALGSGCVCRRPQMGRRRRCGSRDVRESLRRPPSHQPPALAAGSLAGPQEQHSTVWLWGKQGLSGVVGSLLVPVSSSAVPPHPQATAETVYDILSPAKPSRAHRTRRSCGDCERASSPPTSGSVSLRHGSER